MVRKYPLFSKPQPVFYWIIALPLGICTFFCLIPATYFLLMFVSSAFNEEELLDPNESVRSGDVASPRNQSWVGSHGEGDDIKNDFPQSAKNFWSHDGGNNFGCIFYGLFDCDSREDCLKSVEVLGGLRRDQLKAWQPSRYAVIMNGLDYYYKNKNSKPLKSNPWDLRGIKDGLVYEVVQGDHDGMVYYAIDLSRNRVYYHYESGGFPSTVYDDQIEKRWEEAN